MDPSHEREQPGEPICGQSGSESLAILRNLSSEVFYFLGWDLREFGWTGSDSDDGGKLFYYIAFEGIGSDPNRAYNVTKPRFMIGISEDAIPDAILAERLFASWNMDFPVFVTVDRSSLRVFFSHRRYTSRASAPDIILPIADAGELREKLNPVFSIQGPGHTGFWKYIARHQPVSEDGEATDVGASLFRTLESWREILTRRILIANPVISREDLDFSVIRILLRLFREKNTLDNRLDNLVPDFLVDHEDKSHVMRVVPQSTDRSAAIDEDALLHEMSREGLFKCDFRFSLIPIPRVISAFHELLEKRERPNRGMQKKARGNIRIENPLPPDGLVDSCLGLLAGLQVSRRDFHSAILDPACGCGLFLSRLPAILLACRDDRDSDAEDVYYSNKCCYEFFLPCRPDFIHLNGHRHCSADDLVQAAAELYGMDQNPLAVEVCKSILALVFRELSGYRVWNEISSGIAEIIETHMHCGDMLIGEDFADIVEWKFPGEYQGHEAAEPEPSVFLRDVLEMGGFTAITGYFNLRGRKMRRINRHYLQTRYLVFHRESAPLSCMIERSFELLRPGGSCCVVLPGIWLRSKAFRAMRTILAANRIHSIYDVSLLFRPAEEDLNFSVLAASNDPPGGEVMIVRSRIHPSGSPDRTTGRHGYTIPQNNLGSGGWLLVDRRLSDLQKKISSGRPALDEYLLGSLYPGTVSPNEYSSLLSRTEVSSIMAADPAYAVLLEPFLPGNYVSRYGVLKAARFRVKEPCPPEKRDVDSASTVLEKGPKLIIGIVGDGIACTFDQGGFLTDPQTLLIPGEDLYLLGVLNSTLTSFYIGHALSRHPAMSIASVVRRIPVHVADLNDHDEALAYGRIVSAVRQILSLYEELDLHPEKEHEIHDLVERCDTEIDRQIFRLYGSSDDELRIILSFLKRRNKIIRSRRTQ